MTQNRRHCLQEDCPGNSNILNHKETCTNPCRHVKDLKVVRVLIMAEFAQEAIIKDVDFRSTDVKQKQQLLMLYALGMSKETVYSDVATVSPFLTSFF